MKVYIVTTNEGIIVEGFDTDREAFTSVRRKVEERKEIPLEEEEWQSMLFPLEFYGNRAYVVQDFDRQILFIITEIEFDNLQEGEDG